MQELKALETQLRTVLAEKQREIEASKTYSISRDDFSIFKSN